MRRRLPSDDGAPNPLGSTRSKDTLGGANSTYLVITATLPLPPEELVEWIMRVLPETQ